MTNIPSIKLSQLCAILHNALVPVMKTMYWVEAEISSLNNDNKNHHYCNLVETEAKCVLAKINAVIWSNDFQNIFGRFKNETGEDLKNGLKVLVGGYVKYHLLYGLSFKIENIQPSFTLGEAERRRREVLERLKKEGLLQKNSTVPMSVLPIRVALISSKQAAGYQDFVDSLTKSRWGYRFIVRLFPCAMQGVAVEADVTAALTRVSMLVDHFDVVAIARGGGSKMDLDCFNSYLIGRAIANCPIPVITGIGHDYDETVADLVAHIHVKTPTAAAEVILNIVHDLEAKLDHLARDLKAIAKDMLNIQQNQIVTNAGNLSHFADGRLNNVSSAFHVVVTQVERRVRIAIQTEKDTLRTFASAVNDQSRGRLHREITAIGNCSQILLLWPRNLLRNTGRELFANWQSVAEGTRIFRSVKQRELAASFGQLRYCASKTISSLSEVAQTAAVQVTESSKRLISSKTAAIMQQTKIIDLLAKSTLRSTSAALESNASTLTILDPVNMMKRGYSITLINGKVIKNAATVQSGDILETKLLGGTIISSTREVSTDVQ